MTLRGHLHLVDYTAQMMKISGETKFEGDPKVMRQNLPVEKLDWSAFGLSFHVVIAWWTLCYCEEPNESMSSKEKKVRLLEGIRKVLMQGGFLILCEPVTDGEPEACG